MKDNRISEWRQQYNQIPIPQNLKEDVRNLLGDSHKLPTSNRSILYRTLKISLQIASIIGIVIIILPNINAQVAHAIEKIPVIGTITKVVTFRKYEKESNTIKADITTPKIEEIKETQISNNVSESLSFATETLNKTVEEYINELISVFEQDMITLHPEGHMSMETDYKVITDNENLFTLEINTTISKGGATNLVKYYHIDKKTGNIITLEDLFKDGSNYISLISDYIKKQMIEQMEADETIIYAYDNDNPGDKFNEIEADEDFYFNEDNELVIVFDEYQVAAGYMGIVSFIIPPQIIKDITV